MISNVIDRKTHEIKHIAVNACITPVCAVHGMAVTTIEGIGSTRTKLHPVQERIAKAHGTNCGFCTPGIVMSMYALLRSKPKPTMKDMEIAFQGNICRCTGYRSIIEGYKTFTEEYECSMGENCCKNKKNTSEPPMEEEEENKLYDVNEWIPYDSSQEPIFPPELMVSDELDKDSILFYSKHISWYRPSCLKDLLSLKSQHPNAKIIAGNTKVGVDVKLKHLFYPVVIFSNQISELGDIKVRDDGVEIGSSVTLMKIEKALTESIESLPEHRTRLFKAIVFMLHYFGSKQIRSVATLGGNIVAGSPDSDMIPICLAAEVQ